MRRLFAVVFAFGCGCSGFKLPEQVPEVPPDLTPLIATVFASSPEKLLADVGNAKLELDPTVRDPLTGLAACADLVSYCYAPPDLGLSACFALARKCETPAPWNEPSPCCPAACQTAFDAEIARGTGHAAALEKVLFREPDCYPGVRAALEAR
ncbi:MAG: hypothetical protein JNK82_12510 [Myxococcaceae bacterium]|nr:hypothetical protein [Myxococcaceae bacterium]